MKINLDSVLDRTGEVVVVTTNVDLSDARYRGEKPFTAPVRLEARAENRAGVVSLDCVYTFTPTLVCDRCLAPVKREMQLSFSHTVVRALAGEQSDDNYLVVPDAAVELDELALEDILPELPSKILCKEDCRGLCPKCGQNLNEGDCGCDTAVHDPRWDALDDLK